ASIGRDALHWRDQAQPASGWKVDNCNNAGTTQGSIQICSYGCRVGEVVIGATQQDRIAAPIGQTRLAILRLDHCNVIQAALCRSLSDGFERIPNKNSETVGSIRRYPTRPLDKSRLSADRPRSPHSPTSIRRACFNCKYDSFSREASCGYTALARF